MMQKRTRLKMRFLNESFFGRSFNKAMPKCKNGNKCVINKKTRTSCKSCRLRKCFEAGMSKSGSRYGRRSNWFKLNCLIKNPKIEAIVLPQFLAEQRIVEQLSNAERNNGEMESLISIRDEMNVRTEPTAKRECKNQQAQRFNPEDLYSGYSPPPIKNKSRRKINRVLPIKIEDARPRQFDGAIPSTSRAISPSLVHIGNEIDCKRKLLDRKFAQMLRRRDDIEYARRRYAEAAYLSDDSNQEYHPYDCESSSTSDLNSRTLSNSSLFEREQSPYNGDVSMITTSYRNLCNQNLLSPPANLVTLATAQSVPTGGNLVLVSPSPGGLAVEPYDKPIDLSMRSSPNSNRSSENENYGQKIWENTFEENAKALKNMPLDLTAK